MKVLTRRRGRSWIQDFRVEQDLVISRALVAISSSPILNKALADQRPQPGLGPALGALKQPAGVVILSV